MLNVSKSPRKAYGKRTWASMPALLRTAVVSALMVRFTPETSALGQSGLRKLLLAKCAPTYRYRKTRLFVSAILTDFWIEWDHDYFAHLISNLSNPYPGVKAVFQDKFLQREMSNILCLFYSCPWWPKTKVRDGHKRILYTYLDQFIHREEALSLESLRALRRMTITMQPCWKFPWTACNSKAA